MTTAAAPTAPPAWLLAVVSLLGGVATSLAFAPTTWTPLVVVGPAVALWAWTHASTARLGALYGVLYGWSFSFPAFRWMLEVDAVAGVVLPAIQGCFWAVTGAVAAVASARLRPSWWVAVVAATWTLVEVSRARVPLTGFEWGQLSMATADTPVRQAAAAVGAIGVTGAMVAVAAGLATLAFGRDRRSPVPLLVSFVVVGLAVGMGLVRWTSPVADLDVAVIQVDDPCPGVFAQDCPGYSTELLRSYVAGAAQLDRAPDLMVWGEDALLGAETLQQVGTRLMRDAGALPAPLLAGAGTPTAPGRFLRWAALFDANGVAVDGYAKRMPVPFGEYVPLRGLLGGISQVGRLVPNDLEAGQDASPVVLRTDTGVVSLGTVVSWEVTFSRAVRAVAAEANGLAALTTVASYGTTAASDQLLDAAQLRAAEHQKPMVVAATTGRSALIAPTGAMEASSALFRADQLTGSLALRTGLTPFARFGDLPVVLVAVAILLAAVRPWRRVALDETSEAPTGQRGACRSADALPR
ncbi:MAG: apolipoprotein N-acyltransferase [Actinobacteria bacterium]|nr:apolipoprotein N-acyltransferase [Actinomycetota bacterium]